MITGCLMEKRADDEAIKRGIDEGPATRRKLEAIGLQNDEFLRGRYRKIGHIYAKRIAISNFCLELRDPSFSFSPIELRINAAVPEINQTVLAPRKGVKG